MIKTAHIDWYSFTVPLTSINDNIDTMLDIASNSLEYALGSELYYEIFTLDGWELGNGRRPYKGGFVNTRIGCRVWFGGQGNTLVEFSGHGCEWLRQVNLLQQLIEKTHKRCTRIDVAVDIDQSGVTDDIADSVGSDRYKTIGTLKSSTGHTRYIGSRKSDRMVRIYEYFEPNPRAGTTRVEYEHKKAQAKVTASYAASTTPAALADMCGKVYNWQHPLMAIPDYVDKMPTAISSERTDASRMTWIYKQVAPAIRKMIADGKISNPEQWLIDVFMPAIEE